MFNLKFLKHPISLSLLLFSCFLASDIFALTVSIKQGSPPEQALPKESRVPGGVALIPLDNPLTLPPIVHFNDERVMVVIAEEKRPKRKIEHKYAWLAVVGLPLSLKKGKHFLSVKDPKTQEIEKISFKIKDKKYEAQYITLKNKNHVSPSEKDLKRIGDESKKMKGAFKNWSKKTTIPLQFNWPLEGEISSPFGLKRFFNNQPRKPHSGIDIAAPTGTEIKAPIAGTVVATGNYFFNGNTVLIDHGQGLVSMFCHLDKINVKENQLVGPEDIIGLVGQTGRATGPHLHWSVSLNNTRVDPSLFLSN